MTSFLRTAYQIGQLVEEKNAAYGSSFAKSGQFLALLYPDGIRVDQYDDALLLVRTFDKQMRIATDRDALGESPWSDIAGYGICGATHVEQKRKDEACASANGWAATTQPREEIASVIQPAEKPSRKRNKPRTAKKSSAVKSAAATAASSSRKKR